MKIVDTEGIRSTIGPLTGGKAGPGDGNEFQKVLNETIQQTDGAQSPRPAPPLGAPVPIQPPRFSSVLQADADEVIDRVNRFLDQLEDYQHQLANPGVTLKKLDRMVNDIAIEKDRLTQMMQALDPTDGLREILNDTLVTASREILKFQRGDYVG